MPWSSVDAVKARGTATAVAVCARRRSGNESVVADHAARRKMPKGAVGARKSDRHSEMRAGSAHV